MSGTKPITIGLIKQKRWG